MATRRKDRRPSLIRRLVYLAMLLSGGGAGSWFFKDHPQVQAIWALVMGEGPDEAGVGDPVGEVAKAVVGRLQAAGSFSEPGTYQVTIRQVHLDPNLFRAGHTVDIQARVVREDERGRPTTVWDTTRYGERLAVAGKDELIAEWEHDPFQVQWSPGDRLAVEVYDRRAGLLSRGGRFLLESAGSEPREFPLKPGTFPLRAEGQEADATVDPRNVHIVLGSQRVGDVPGAGRDRAPASTAARDDDQTIVIK
jgi:hypothetical protein